MSWFSIKSVQLMILKWYFVQMTTFLGVWNFTDFYRKSAHQLLIRSFEMTHLFVLCCSFKWYRRWISTRKPKSKLHNKCKATWQSVLSEYRYSYIPHEYKRSLLIFLICLWCFLYLLYTLRRRIYCILKEK